MQRRTAFVLSLGLLLACFLLYLFFPKNQHTEVSVETPIVTKEKVEEQVEIATEMVVETLEEESETAKPVTQEIKEKVKEVVEGVFNLFKKDQKFVAIGDSLTQGVGDETENGGYVGILNHTFEANNLNITIDNFGKRGNRSDQLLKRLEDEKIASSIKEADVIFVTIGANDIMRIVRSNLFHLEMEDFHSELDGYVERLRAIFTKMGELNPDAQIYLIGFYNPFQYYFNDIEELSIILETWNEAGKSVTDEFSQVNYIPTADLFIQAEQSVLAEDYFHPNTSGYKLMAQRVLDYINVNREDAEMITGDIE